MRVLFTGYAHVHFACFRPLYERLTRIPGVEVFLSGGLRSGRGAGLVHDERAMYEPFVIPPEHVLPVEEIREQDFDVLFAGNTKLILPRCVERRIQIFHGVSFRNRAVRPENLGCDYYFIIGPYMRRRFVEAELMREDDPRMVPIGFMKTDRLLNAELDRGELLSRYGLDGRRPVLLYAPTGLRYNSLETMGEAVVERLAATGRYDLLIKLHDHPKNKKIDWRQRLHRFEDAHCRVVSDLDVTPLLALANLLISDASSVSNEYALLDRPMVFLDVPKLLARARERAGSMLDLDTWGRKGGVIVEDPEQVVDAVDEGLERPKTQSDVRRRTRDNLFYNPGCATDAAMSWLGENLLPGAPSRAAAVSVP